MNQRHVVLVVLDGWGYSPVFEGNAIAQANTPNFDRLWKESLHALLQASGEAVGLPWGEMGNSEVGHLNIGAGRVVTQDLPRISAAVADGSFFENKALVAACEHVTSTGGALHLIGLASSGGVHSHIRHLFALLKLASQQGVKQVYCHVFTDGRDASPRDGINQIKKLEQEIAQTGLGRIASVSGRYYAMDRDKHWDRTKLAFEAIANGRGPTADSAATAIQAAYTQDITDEFIMPTVITEGGRPVAEFTDSDAAIFFNFRPDRTRQLVETFAVSEFTAFNRTAAHTGLYFVTMTEYEKNLPVHVAFRPLNVADSLAKVVSDQSVRQFHIAETEKYPHATFFFNGGIEEPYPQEERLLIASPHVPTYDQQPEMSAKLITAELEKRVASGDYQFIMVNYANPDMVGHSGNFEATRKAIEAVDACLGRLARVTAEHDTFLLITADHGNAEEMTNFTTGEIHTEHTTNPVPFLLVVPPSDKDFAYGESRLTLRTSRLEPTGLLGDVAPTVLKLLDIDPPDGMQGYGLL